MEAYKRSLKEYYKVIGKLDPQSGNSAAASEKLTINRRRSGSYKYISTSIAGVAERYFAYQRASLTGGVAIKAGESVLSIMALNTSNPDQFPKLR